jgi:hypothetical protein
MAETDRFVAQGTVQVRLTEKECFVAINPGPGYSVKHKDKDKENDYVVFVGKDGCLVAKIFPRSELRFQPGNGRIRTMLIYAALHNTSVEVEIDNEDKIVGVKVPPAFK